MGGVGDFFDTATALGKATVATLLAVDVVALTMAITAMVREWVVPGRAHQREILRNDKLEETNAKLADSLDRITEVLESAKRGR